MCKVPTEAARAYLIPGAGITGGCELPVWEVLGTELPRSSGRGTNALDH